MMLAPVERTTPSPMSREVSVPQSTLTLLPSTTLHTMMDPTGGSDFDAFNNIAETRSNALRLNIYVICLGFVTLCVFGRHTTQHHILVDQLHFEEAANFS
jgi:hypothetical protein